MFEDSLFASQHRVISSRQHWTAAASIALQAAIASLLIVIPVLHTELLPTLTNRTPITVPLATLPPPRTMLQRATSSTMASVVPVMTRLLTAPRITPTRIDASLESVPVSSFTNMAMGSGTTPGALVGAGDSATKPIAVSLVPAKKPGPVRVSAGVSAGLLLAPIRPVYPQIAKAAHISGTVIVAATISKAGTIESLHVLSGPAMLQSSAIDAIRAARYRPFLLSGEPTEVETTITVNFIFGS